MECGQEFPHLVMPATQTGPMVNDLLSPSLTSAFGLGLLQCLMSGGGGWRWVGPLGCTEATVLKPGGAPLLQDWPMLFSFI